jgi:flagellar motor switch protein FliN/FliY
MAQMDDKSIEELLAAVEAQTQAITNQAVSTGDVVADVMAEHPLADAMLGVMEAPGSAREPEGAPASPGGEIHRLLAIEVPVIVRLGQRRMPVAEVMRLAVGAIVEFGKSADDELELLVNNKLIGMGNAVKVGENFGIKITKIGPIKDTIKKLGGV